MSSQSKIIKDILSLYDTILEKKEVEETADSLRSTIKTLGYTEKGSELTSGGNVNDKITELVAQILSQYKKTNPNVNVKITAGNDNYHQKLNYTSQHKLGNAIDVVLDPYNSKNASAFINILNDFKNKNNLFSYIDEYTNPSDAATAKHFHLQYGGNSSSNNTSGGTSIASTSSSTPSQYNIIQKVGKSLLDTKVGKEMVKSTGLGLSEAKVYSSFGKNYVVRNGEVIIPKEDNKKIKSPVSGYITSFLYNSNCLNQLFIKFKVGDKTFYLEYCGLKSVSVRLGQSVSQGEVIGMSDTDIRVTLYGTDGNKKYIDTKIESNEKKSGNDDYSNRDLNNGLYTSAYRKVRDTWFKKDKVQENIDRIKGLL
jgi:murein DD-endopeptidase MepM/ murein hydrolase activator NlpD